MKNLIYYLIVILLITAFSCGIKAPDEKNPLTSIELKTRQTLEKLGDTLYATSDGELIDIFKALEKKQRSLFKVLWRCDRNNKLEPGYVTTLSKNQEALDSLYRNYDTVDNKKFIMESVYMDYDAKRRSINYYVSKDANAKIKVIVNSNEEEGYFVFAKLSYEKDKEVKRFRFDGPTNNAAQYFVPGYYLFWLEKGERTSDPELHLIVGDGTETERKLTLKDPK